MSFIYLLAYSEGDLIKVGKANDVRKRVKGLQVSSPFHMQVIHTIEVSARYALELEKAIHRRLKRRRCHVQGEWFRIKRHIAIEQAELVAKAFGRVRSFADLDENGLACVKLRCRDCRHQATIKIEPRRRQPKFTCSKCGTQNFSYLV